MLAVPFLHDELMCAQPSASDSALQFVMVVDRLDPQGGNLHATAVAAAHFPCPRIVK